MRGALDIVDRTLKILLEVLMAAMVLDVTWQVVSRYLLRDPSSVTEEIARFLLIWIGLLGAAWAFRRRSHLGIDILTVRLKGRKRAAARVFTYAASIFFALLVMGIGGIRLVALTLELDQVSAALGLRMGYIYLAVPLSGLLIVFYAAAFILETVKDPEESRPAGPGEENF
jgi:TRAP-type C4-dicarboxylate transport system permease small subunit